MTNGSSTAPPATLARAEAKEDSGLAALCGVAAYYRIAAEPARLTRELALRGPADLESLLRAGKLLGLRARIAEPLDAARLRSLPTPAILPLAAGGFAIFAGETRDGFLRLVHPLDHTEERLAPQEAFARLGARALLLTRRLGGPGADPQNFGFAWFWPSLWRYRRPIAHVLLASLVVQGFALATPLLFQVVIDKVLGHKGYDTLYVVVGALAALGLFEVVLQHLRTYALTHTANRIDVELGQRLFAHLMRLPLGWFETRAAGQTAARARELESIRAFLTGQGLFSVLDLVFATLFIAVLFAYSMKLALIVVASIPFYVLIAVFIRPILKTRIDEKFNRAALSQQFLVKAIVSAQTVKAAAIEPVMRAEWEERLAAYVRTSFDAAMAASLGQNAIQYVEKVSRALLLLFGAKAVMDGELTVGAFVAFNMIAGHVSQPVLRLSQLWQDFQQVQTSVARLGDILNAPAETANGAMADLPRPRGAIELRHVGFRYERNGPEILKDVSLTIAPGEVIGIVGPSGSGKSSLTKLIQRLYTPQSGQILVDGIDISQVDPSWLRRNIGVVLQENLLFNRTIHDNIALADPAMPRAQVIRYAQLAGADEFISRLPRGYDTMIEERGSNLSGGQRQRIAIARALATEPRILIFDEATSALDYESERVIQRNMREIVRGRTVIIVAHRLAAVRACHRIIGLEDGRIVEAGSHEDLLTRPGGLYARLWRLQSEGEGAP